MFFRNLTLLRFPAPPPTFIHSLDDATRENQLKPVGPQELSSHGWVSPSGQPIEVDQELPFGSGDALWLTLGIEERMLPAAVVNAELSWGVRAIEEQEGRKLGGRTRKRLKEDIVAELLPRSFVKPSRLDGYLDLKRGLVVVDTTSRRAAELFVSALRHSLGSFPALPLNAEVPPRAVLTGWIAGDPLPEGLSLGDEATLKDAADNGASIRAARQELASEEIAKHLEAGKQVTRLGLQLDDHVSFSLDESLTIRKLKF